MPSDRQRLTNRSALNCFGLGMANSDIAGDLIKGALAGAFASLPAGNRRGIRRAIEGRLNLHTTALAIRRHDSAQRRHVSAQRCIVGSSSSRSHSLPHASHTSAHTAHVLV